MPILKRGAGNYTFKLWIRAVFLKLWSSRPIFRVVLCFYEREKNRIQINSISHIIAENLRTIKEHKIVVPKMHSRVFK